jgi:hypothetical protein
MFIHMSKCMCAWTIVLTFCTITYCLFTNTTYVCVKLHFAGANQLRGFWSGFSALFNSVEYGFLVPYFDGVQYSGLAVRVEMEVCCY